MFERAAELDCSASYYHLGSMYEEGLGADIDLSLAKKVQNCHRKRQGKASRCLKKIDRTRELEENVIAFIW